MFSKLYPCAYAKDVFSVDYQKLYDAGYRGILFDVDNTLVHHNENSTPEVDALLKRIGEIGLKTVLVSNNGTTRLARFTETNGAAFVADANKPAPHGLEKAVALLGIAREQALVIGDQMYVDILGANNAGLDSILVHFMVKKKGEWIGVKRYMEKFVLFFFNIRKSRHKLGYAVIKR